MDDFVTNMKKVADDFRIIVKQSDYNYLMKNEYSHIDTSKHGYYLHKNKYYRYFITRLFVDYFLPVNEKIIKVGIKA